MTRSQKAVRLDALKLRGFDESYALRSAYIRVKCSQCEALVVNGTATHEQGCPNQTRSCDECGTPVPKQYRLCDDCSGASDDYTEPNW